MTREGFSEMLATIRITNGVSMNKMHLLSGLTTTEIIRIEKAKNNYGLGYIIRFLRHLNYFIVFSNNAHEVCINEQEDFASWLAESKEQSKISLRSIASNIDCSYQTLSYIVNNKYNVKIDLLLKLVDYFGYTIEFKPIQQ